MARIESKLAALGLVLPAPLKAPPGVPLPFAMVRIVGTRAIVSGHGPQNADGSLAQPLGKVGADLTIEQGYAAARLTGLCVLSTLRRYLGSLDPVTRVVRVQGFVNCAPGFNTPSDVLHGFSDLMVEVFGDNGRHTRAAIGAAELYADIPCEIEATFEVAALDA